MKEVGDRVKERMLGTLVRPSEDPETTEPFIEIEPRGLWVLVHCYPGATLTIIPEANISY